MTNPHPGTVRSDRQAFRQVEARFRDEVGRILVRVNFVRVWKEYTAVQLGFPAITPLPASFLEIVTFAASLAPVLWLLGAVMMLKRLPLGFFIVSTFMFGMMFIEPTHVLAPFWPTGRFHYVGGMWTAPVLAGMGWYTFLAIRREIARAEKGRIMSTTNPADTFTRMLHAIDAKDWAGVRSAFADRVTMDYSSLFGAPAATVNADAQVAEWQAFVSALDVTQHITGPFVVTSGADEATAHTHIRAYHQIKDAKGGEIWMVAGHYTVRLVPTGESWKIAGITLQVFYQEGNREIPELARARAAGAERPS